MIRTLQPSMSNNMTITTPWWCSCTVLFASGTSSVGAVDIASSTSFLLCRRPCPSQIERPSWIAICVVECFFFFFFGTCFSCAACRSWFSLVRRTSPFIAISHPFISWFNAVFVRLDGQCTMPQECLDCGCLLLQLLKIVRCFWCWIGGLTARWCRGLDPWAVY